MRVLQIGAGNFLRGFTCWMFNRLNATGLFDGSIVVTQSAPPDSSTISAMNEQDGLYTLLMRGLHAGTPVDQSELITSVTQAIDPFSDWSRALALAAEPALRYVVSNTTEAGIRYEARPYEPDHCPELFPARAALMLYERFQRCGGREDGGWVFLPCELIERNGRTLRQHILQHADDWDLPGEFRGWVAECCVFADTLVDRITPGFPGDEADALCERLGYEDRLLVAAEWYYRWVIEAPAKVRDELPLDRAGLNVTWTSDLMPYRTTKVRILNGAHTAMVPIGLLRGKVTVRESMEDEHVMKYVRALLFDEVIPSLDVPGDEAKRFANETLERFANPYIEHRLSSIALNSVSKWRVRVLPSLLAYVDRFGELPRALPLSLAALIVLYRGERFPIHDEADVETCFADAWRRYDTDEDLAVVIDTLLGSKGLWGRDLRTVAGLPGDLEIHVEEMLIDE